MLLGMVLCWIGTGCGVVNEFHEVQTEKTFAIEKDTDTFPEESDVVQENVPESEPEVETEESACKFESGQEVSSVRPTEKPETFMGNVEKESETVTDKPEIEPETVVSRPTNKPEISMGNVGKEPEAVTDKPDIEPETVVSRPTEKPEMSMGSVEEEPEAVMSKPVVEQETTTSEPEEKRPTTTKVPVAEAPKQTPILPAEEPRQTPIPPVIHVHEVATEQREATCLETGIEKEYCKLCKEVLREKTTDPLGHDFVKSVWELPTCQKGGYYNDVCSRCGLVVCVSQEPLAHETEDIILQEGNCMEDTVIQHRCRVCGMETMDETRYTLYDAHTWVAAMVDGEEITYCERCGISR